MKRLGLSAATAFTVIAGLVMGAPAAHAAVGDPSLAWANTPPSSVQGNQSVFTAQAAATTAGVIDKVCAQIDAHPITTDIGAGSGGYYGDLVASNGLADFNTATGCWTRKVTNAAGLTGLGLRPDTTQFLDGTHTLTLVVTDNLGQSLFGSGTATISTSFTTSNAAPVTSVLYRTNGDVVHGAFDLTATGTPDSTGTAQIVSWCVKRDGVHETQNVAWHSGVYYGDLQTATFSAATGCWTRESSANPMTGVTLHYDSTGWTNNSHTFQLTATDTSGRTGTVSISLQSANAAPVLSFLNHVNGDSVTGQLQVQMTGIPDRQSTAAIVSWCVIRDGVKESKNAASQTGAYYGDLLSPNATFSAATGCWTRASSSTVVESATLAYDTTQWIDGNHTLTVTVKDTSLKSATGTITVHTVNGNTVKATLAVTPKPLVVGTAAAKLTATCGITFGLMKQCAVVVKAGGKTVASGTVKTTSGAASAKLTMTINATGRAMVQAQGGVLPVTLTATVTPMSGALLTATAVDSLLAKTVSITLSSSVLFSSASSVLTPASVKVITALGVKLKGSKMATCAGYTDNQGSASYNLALGLARAKAVCAVLGKYVKKTSAVSFGLTHPVASNATEAGRAKNRRVVLTISN